MSRVADLYGIMAEFDSPAALLDAVERARAAGYRDLEAFSPLAIDGLAEKLGAPAPRVPLAALLGGVLGGTGAYFMQWYSAFVDYPINSGGRPLDSWPSFIPATFELTILGAATATFAAFLFMSGLPRLNHPIFNAPRFDLASRSRFFLCVTAQSEGFDADKTTHFLRELHPVEVVPVPLDDDT